MYRDVQKILHKIFVANSFSSKKLRVYYFVLLIFYGMIFFTNKKIKKYLWWRYLNQRLENAC